MGTEFCFQEHVFVHRRSMVEFLCMLQKEILHEFLRENYFGLISNEMKLCDTEFNEWIKRKMETSWRYGRILKHLDQDVRCEQGENSDVIFENATVDIFHRLSETDSCENKIKAKAYKPQKTSVSMPVIEPSCENKIKAKAYKRKKTNVLMPVIEPKGLKVSFETEAIPWIDNDCVQLHLNGQKRVMLNNTASSITKKATNGINNIKVKERFEMGSEDFSGATLFQEYKMTFMTRRATMFLKDVAFIDILTKSLELYSIILFVMQTSRRIYSIKHPFSKLELFDWDFGAYATTAYFILQWFLRLYIIIKWKHGKNNFKPFLLGQSGFIRTSTFVSLINMTLEGIKRRTILSALIRFFISFFVEKIWECRRNARN